MADVVDLTEVRELRQRLAAGLAAKAIAGVLTEDTARRVADAIAGVAYDLAKEGEPEEARLVLKIAKLIRDGGKA